MKYTAALIALASYVQAQSSAASAASVVASAVVSVQPGSSLSMSSMTGPVPSAAQSASPSGIPVTANTSYGYECPAGYSLTYGIANATFAGVDLSTAVMYFSNWTGSAPGMVISSTGSNMTGATRTYMPMGANYTISEVLTNSTIDMMTGALHQVTNSTSAFMTMGVNVASTFNDLQVYANATTGATTIQIFSNVCADNQALVLLGLAVQLESAIQYWATQLTGAVQSASMSGMSMMSAPSSMASMTSMATAGGLLSSAAGRLSSATGAPAAALSSATGVPAAALSSLTAGITNAIPSIRARAAGRWQ